MKIAIPNESFSGYDLQTPANGIYRQFPQTTVTHQIQPKLPPKINTKPRSNNPFSRQNRQLITIDDVAHFAIKQGAQFTDFMTAAMALVFAVFSICSLINLLYTLFKAFSDPDHFVLGFSSQQKVLSSFFYVLIATELLHSSMLHFDQNQHYASGMVFVAVTAVARKIIILDYKHASFKKIAAMSAIVSSLGVICFVLHKVVLKKKVKKH
ncbi:Phosphate-starvation-inducible E family protein [Spironucleus salmonicida]|uniref:Phosphate-starvation-inducible E family protein n=1 Tax=Spironucleus salmonicida TaxID=348837 RepID=V6LQ58_9EUKA|nr:Phosphate-starvation-inducible E family protein [Spironucleus salmonicida]|eukprot:EST46383.1 Phosphate-starvation-inducible E family protein [Spironucleus salmonicida]